MAGLAAPASQAKPAPLALGFFDELFLQGTGAERETWLSRAGDTGASVIRLSARWSAIAPVQLPAGFDARDPAAPGYRWDQLDDAVRATTAAGLRPLVTIGSAPAWAEGVGRAENAPAGTWKPQPARLADFAHAIATRYSGAFPDPHTPGQFLPRVALWQVWNEPNLSLYLTPQWRRGGKGWRLASPDVYRPLLDAGYREIKAVHTDNIVAAAGTAPYGDLHPGQPRTPPAVFVRGLLCLDDRLRRLPCRDPARFDVLDHHPYGIAGPGRRALNSGDVGIPDLAKLTGPLRAAERLGTALPGKRHGLWITEVSWDSSPPDPDGVPSATLARWIPATLRTLWSEGASLIMWLQIQDDPPTPSYATTYQAGMYLLDGTPKPTRQAFRFPLVVEHGRFWTRVPSAGRLLVQRRSRAGWTTVGTRAVSSGQVLTGALKHAPHGSSWRAVVGADASLTARAS